MAGGLPPHEPGERDERAPGRRRRPPLVRAVIVLILVALIVWWLWALLVPRGEEVIEEPVAENVEQGAGQAERGS